MSLQSLLVRDVTILTAGSTTDRYKNEIADWSAPTETPAKAWIAQATAIEDHDHRDATVTALTATFDSCAPVTARSRVVLDGITYEVDGEPNVAWTPRGAHHIECALKAVTG